MAKLSGVRVKEFGGKHTMNTLIVYDSLYGNTKLVAEAIGNALPGEVQSLPVGRVNTADMVNVDLLIIGSPTHGAMPTEAIQGLLEKLEPPANLRSRAATFDTRLTWFFLERWGGFAAPKMAATLKEKGWHVIGEPAGFLVGGLKKGPLKPGQLERAAVWASSLTLASDT
jgi:flavodoxin